MDDDYYDFLKQGKVNVDGVVILDVYYLIPFKAKAWLDLTSKNQMGEHVDSKNIRKHRNDVFRLSELITSSMIIKVPYKVYLDIIDFITNMESEDIDIKQLGIVGKDKKQILNDLRNLYLPY